MLLLPHLSSLVFRKRLNSKVESIASVEILTENFSPELAGFIKLIDTQYYYVLHPSIKHRYYCLFDSKGGERDNCLSA